MATTLKKDYTERIVPALMKEFNYSTVMQVPKLKKIVINQGLGQATQDKKIIETAINELTAITGQKAVATTISAVNATCLLTAVQKGSHVSIVPTGVPITLWMSMGMDSIWSQTLATIVVEIEG